VSLDVVYLAWNRLEYTQATFALLLENTEWRMVDRLVVYDDGSTDGTCEWLREACADAPTEVKFRTRELRSPPAIMNDYLGRDPATLWAKIDNDIAVPRGWLQKLCRVMADHNELAALGMAAGWTGVKGGKPGVQTASHIGGVGLFRSEHIPLPVWSHGRYGWTEQQHKTESIRTGWITPDVQAVQLDLVPEEPWVSLADYYVAKRWARWWPKYEDPSLWAWMPNRLEYDEIVSDQGEVLGINIPDPKVEA
jgi:hypothetical protein